MLVLIPTSSVLHSFFFSRILKSVFTSGKHHGVVKSKSSIPYFPIPSTPMTLKLGILPTILYCDLCTVGFPFPRPLSRIHYASTSFSLNFRGVSLVSMSIALMGVDLTPMHTRNALYCNLLIFFQ